MVAGHCSGEEGGGDMSTDKTCCVCNHYSKTWCSRFGMIIRDHIPTTRCATGVTTSSPTPSKTVAIGRRSRYE